MSKQKSVVGTPLNHVGPKGAFIGSAEGYAAVPPRAPKGLSGTVNKQFEGDQKGNRQVGIASGTPATFSNGNPNESSHVRSQGRYGISRAGGGVDMNDPAANGNGAVFDGVTRARGYVATGKPAMDSPVPTAAPYLDLRTIEQENRAHLGQGNAALSDDLRTVGGVMSRGLQGTSKPSGGEEELREDDTLRNMGAGGAVG